MISLIYYCDGNGELVIERITNVPMLALPTVRTYAPDFNNGLVRKSLMSNHCHLTGESIPQLMAALTKLGYHSRLVDRSEFYAA